MARLRHAQWPVASVTTSKWVSTEMASASDASQTSQPLFRHLLYRLQHYALLVRLHRPIGTYLLLWPTLWALWIAGEGRPDPLVLFIFVSGVVLMRSAGCAINDYADRHVDPHVARTRSRPLASGAIAPWEAIMVFVLLSLVAFALVLLTNLKTILLSVAAVSFAATYPFMKRIHHLPQAHLGAAFSFAVPMAFTAELDTWPPLIAWLLFLANILWTMAYDSMYAITDREDDLLIGVKSTAILFGRYDRLIIALLQLATFGLLLAVGWILTLGLAYYLGLAAAAIFAIYEQLLIRNRDPQLALRAFLNNAWLGMAVFIGLVLHYIYNAQAC